MSSSGEIAWRPTAPPELLRARASLLRQLRDFFAKRDVLEVETPLLCGATVTDRHLDSLTVPLSAGTGYLQTSPEYAMKRLLASGIGSCFQMAKCFRGEESGPRHNPEFTLLEWYRVGWDHHRLIEEVVDLVGETTGVTEVTSLPYRAAGLEATGIDLVEASIESLRDLALTGCGLESDSSERDELLQLLFSQLVEPHFPADRITVVTDYPASQAALARIDEEREVAERFEVFVGALELANGYHELLGVEEHRRRFGRDLEARREQRLPLPPLDERFLAALEHGLPPCAGVALGVDRLLMIREGAERIDEVLAFPIDRA